MRASRLSVPRPRQLAGAGVVLLVVWALSTGAALWLVVREPIPQPDVLLVLAGAPVYQERVAFAAALARSNRARVLLTNDGQRGRWSRALQRNPASVERATDALVSAGIERDRIEVLPGIVHGTIDEARAFRLYAEAHHVRSALVVTSPYHSRRAVWTIRRMLRGTPAQVGIAPVPMASTSSHPSTWWNTSMGWRNVALEFVKMPYYWLAY